MRLKVDYGCRRLQKPTSPSFFVTQVTHVCVLGHRDLFQASRAFSRIKFRVSSLQGISMNSVLFLALALPTFQERMLVPGPLANESSFSRLRC